MGRDGVFQSVRLRVSRSTPSVIGDGNGGFIAVWRDERDIYSDLYMQHIGANGTPVWEKDGIPLLHCWRTSGQTVYR